MTQHITQEQAVDLATRKIRAESGPEYVHELCNAAIQHYLDQHKAELPVLPGPYFGSGRYLGEAGSRGAYTTTQIQTYGAACAAQARKLALEEAEKRMLTKAAELGIYNHHATKALVEALKGK